VITAKVLPSGELAFVAYYAGPESDDGLAVTFDAQGNTLVGAYYINPQTMDQDFLTLKYGPTGNLLWEKSKDFAGWGDRVEDIATDSAGNVYVCGFLGYWDGNDGTIVSYTPQGQERWSYIHDEPQDTDDQQMRQVRIGSDGFVYVNNFCEVELPAAYDFSVLRFTAEGVLVGEERFDTGSHSDVSVAFELDGQNNAYWAGTVWTDDQLANAALFKAVQSGAPCAPDLDGNGALDLFDFLAFTNLFNAQDPGADMDNNGAFDLFDFLAYVNLFNAGC
jgi:hypothetical protein